MGHGESRVGKFLSPRSWQLRSLSGSGGSASSQARNDGKIPVSKRKLGSVGRHQYQGRPPAYLSGYLEGDLDIGRRGQKSLDTEKV